MAQSSGSRASSFALNGTSFEHTATQSIVPESSRFAGGFHTGHRSSLPGLGGITSSQALQMPLAQPREVINENQVSYDVRDNSATRVNPTAIPAGELAADDTSDLEEGEVSEGIVPEQPGASSIHINAQDGQGMSHHPARTQRPSPRMASSNVRGSGKTSAGPQKGFQGKRQAQGRHHSNWPQNSGRKQLNHNIASKDHASGDVSTHRHGVSDTHPRRPDDITIFQATLPGAENLKGAQAGTARWFSVQRDRAQEFLTMLYRNQVMYDQLLHESVDQELLQNILHELQLPINSSNTRPDSRGNPGASCQRISPSQTSSLPKTVNNSNHQAFERTAASPPIGSISPAGNVQSKVVTAKPLAVDQPSTITRTSEPKATVASSREEYSARLMAAKAKKNTLLAGNSAARASSSPASTVSLMATATTKPTSPQAASFHVSAEQATTIDDNASTNEQKKKAQTDLIRLRMEALKSAKPQTRPQPSTEKQQQQQQQQGNVQDVQEFIDQVLDSRPISSVRQDGNKVSSLESSLRTSASTSESRQASSPLSGRIPGLDHVSGAVGLSPNISEAPETPGTEQQSMLTFLENSQAQPKSRKRPVASDFMEGPLPEHFKRPFGQTKGNEKAEEIIIEVSDDESESEQTSRPLHQPPNSYFPSYTTSTAEANSGTSAPQRAQLSRQASETTASRGGIKLAAIQDQEARIAAMRQRILELERKKKSKTSQAHNTIPSDVDSLEGTPSRMATPTYSKHSKTEVPKSKRIERPNSLLVDQTGQTDTDQETLLETDAKFGAHARGVDASQSPHTVDSLEWKRKRQDEIRSGIPAFEAKAATNLSKMESLKEQMKQLEEEMRIEQEAKEQLIQELQELGVDTNGMPTKELQATKDAILSQQISAHDGNSEVSANPLPSQEQEDGKLLSTYISSADRSLSASPASTSRHSGTKKGSVEDFHPRLQSIRHQNLSDLPISITSSSIHTPEPVVVSPSASYMNAQPRDTPDFLHSGPESLSMVASEDGDLRADSDDEMDDASSILEEGELDENEGEQNAGSTRENHQQNAATIEAGDSEDMDMPDAARTSTKQPQPLKPVYSDSSGANQYSVEVPETQSEAEQPNKDKDKSSLEDATLSDDYEPPDAAPEQAQNNAVIESDDDYEPPDAGTGAIGTKPTLGDAERVIVENPKSQYDLSEQTRPVAELGSSLQPLQQEGIAGGPSLPEDQFTPYSSPLKMFKAYRYHPDFAKDTSDGFFSLTYSSNIDPDNPLCQYEAAGGACNDLQCEDQHFRSMAIAGDAVLTQLGMDNPGQSREEKIAWNEGLKRVLHELAARNTRDVQVVAAAIVDYRRRFLNDPSNILNLQLAPEA